MLSILNTLCHGYVAIPVIQACRRRRIFEDWPVGNSVPFLTVARTAEANPGYLRIALSMLEALGWIARDGDAYQRILEIDFNVIPEDILDLYRIAPEALFTNTAIQLRLSQWLADLRKRQRSDSSQLSSLTEGALLLPVLIALRKVAVPEQTALPPGLDSALRLELCSLFVEKGWGHEEKGAFEFSNPGKELIERAYVMAIAVSYRPMLAKVEELLFGNSAAVFERDESVAETHIDRQMNVIASGFQHQRYFKDAEHHLLTLFNDVPLAEQPRYIADIGCGDGTFLKNLYEAISTKTARGRNLARYPLRVIGVDYNRAALIETEKTLREIPHITFVGDIGDPQQIVSELEKQGIVDPENTLYIRSFLDHNFQYKAAPQTGQSLRDEFPLVPGSHYIDSKGLSVGGNQLLEAWRAHLQRWATIINPHGLVILESHCLPPSISNRYFDRTESFYFDAVHALSGQYLVDAEVFIILAASVGLFPHEPPVRYPKTLPFCRITLNHFEKRDYVVRHAQLRDLDSLLDLENQCWEFELRTSRSDIVHRLKTYPQGQFVLELEGRVAGVIYSQRIENVQVLTDTTVDLVASYHRADGPVVQLIALNIFPSLQGRKLGDELLKFMLQRSSVMNGVEKVVGVTVCKDHVLKKGGAAFLEYVRSRDEHGKLLDPNLRFHEFHGAIIGEVIEGYRPKDFKNDTHGVLIRYDIYNLKRRARLENGISGTEPSRAQNLENNNDLRLFVESSIRRCLGEHKTPAYAPDRPLMEMGLDSADLLELSELLSVRFNITLEPAFFFDYKTCNRIIGYLNSRVGLLPSVQPIPVVAAKSEPDDEQDGIAIIGIATRLPGDISTIEELWKLLKDGKSAIGTIPAGRWQWPPDIEPQVRHAGIDQGGFLKRLDTFDAAFFRISPREAELMDPQQRILMELAWQAIEDAGYSQESLADTRTGVFVGASGSDYLRLLDNAAVPVEAQIGTGNSMAILANRLSYFFDFHGPSLQIDTACSSSLVALHYAIQSLRTGESSQALVGGIHLMCHPANTIAYYKAGMLSHDGACKTLDSRADGYVRSEGAVMIFIKPLKTAKADGDPIYAVIKGTAINHGGQASGLTVPNPEKQAGLLQSAWDAAGVSPDTITYIEMHGTGTPLGDPIEVDGIRRAFSRSGSARDSACGLGSVKTNLGHLEAAAGLTGLLKAILCLIHRELPATVHLKEMNRHLHLEGSPLYVVREHQDWDMPQFNGRRRAGVSSFGFGGANAHAVLEEYSQLPFPIPDTKPAYLFILSARTAERLHAYAERYAHWLSSDESVKASMDDLTYTLQVGRQAMDSRLALIVKDKVDLIEKLELFISQSDPAGRFFHNTIRFDDREISETNADFSQDAKVLAALDANDLKALARLWTSGGSIPWEAFYRDRHPTRIPLPAYPFAPVSHWFSALAQSPEEVEPPLHPLVQSNTSTRSQPHFTSTFTGREFFLSDHQVSGRSVLPGVAYVEMARKACEVATGSKIEGKSGLCFTSVIWAQPIQLSDKPKTVHVRLNVEDSSSIGYEIYSDSEGLPEHTILHGQGTVAVRALDSVPRLDFNSLREKNCVRHLDSDEFYSHYQNGGIRYGLAHQGISEMFVGAGQAVARISLPSLIAATAGDYVLHPSMVDSALQAGMVLAALENPPSNESPLLPFSAESIEVFAQTQGVMWAWVRFVDSEMANADPLRPLDVDLCDESGSVCVRFRKLSVRRAQEKTATSVEPHELRSLPMMIKPVWTPCRPVPMDVVPDDSHSKVLIFGAKAEAAPTLKKMFPAGTFVDPALAEKFEDYDNVDHVVWFAGSSHAQSVSDQLMVEGQSGGVLRLFSLIKALLHQGHAARKMIWTICTVQTQAIRATDRVDPTHAGIHGLAGCMAKEFPNWRVRLIDLESDSPESATAFFRLPDDTSGRPLAIRRGQWFRREFVPIREFSTHEKLFRQNGIYVVIGGAGGLGEEWSRWLIERYQAQMIWIGRREKNSSIQGKIDALGTIGPAPYYISADAADRESLQAAFDEIKGRFPKINGVVHSAIVLKDGSLANMTPGQFTESLTANVDVCVRIAQVFDPETLDFVLFFSSIQSFCTFGGQSNYAAGCTFKDAFAERLRRDRPCVVKVVNWGYWGSIGVVANDYYRESMALKGFGSIEPEDGFELLERFVDGPMVQLAIVKTLRRGVIDGLREDEWFTADTRSNASLQNPNWLPRIPQLNATLADGGLNLPGLTPILGKVLWGTIQALGFSGRNQAPVSAIRNAIDGNGRFQRWIEESLNILERQNHLQVDGDICFATDPTLVAMDDVWKEWNVEKERCLSNTDTRSQVTLLDKCLRNLQELLTGKVLATDVIFAHSSPDLAGGIYRNNQIADYFNNALAAIVKSYIEERLKSDPAAKCRILEIGAGTGGTTAAVMSVLAPFRNQISEYCFTDISAAFLIKAHEQFDRDWPNLVTRKFDIEIPLAEQSISLADYDVVFAANALHATHDIRNTIRNAKAALRRDGLLVLNELSSNSLFLHLTFGLLQGWWLFEDPELRIQGCPGLYPEAWKNVLAGEGFQSIAFPATQAHVFGQQIVVAQSDGIIRQRESAKSISSPSLEAKQLTRNDAATPMPSARSQNDEAITNVPDPMIENRVRIIVREAIAANLKMNESDIQDGRVFSDYGVDSIIGVQVVNQINQRCSIVIPVTALFDYSSVHELSSFVTRKFRPILLSSLFHESLTADSPGNEIESSPRVEAVPRVPDSQEVFSRQVVIEGPGQVRDMAITLSDIPPLKAHEVRIAVRACSLNFADLLCVKGLYPNMPEYPFVPGIEASGVVVAVGTSVRTAALGEAVIAFMGKNLGAHATVITCPENKVLRKPESLSFEEACSLPAVAVTMVYAFRKAQLKPGDSILIQTATGGTGLVAVQLAQHYGAKIYATAGSSEKLDYLKKLGVAHAINYRQTDFATEIQRLTQGKGVDVVINTLSGDAIQKGLNCLSAGGRYIEVAMTALKSAKAIDLSVLRNNQAFYSVDLLKLASEEPETFAACYDEMIEWVRRGVIRPAISHVFPFDRIQDAYAYLEERRNIGKVVLSVAPVAAMSDRERKAGDRSLEPVAVVGMSGRFAKSPSLTALWEHLANGDDLVDKVTRWDLRRAYQDDFQEIESNCYDGGLLEDIDKFDPAFFDISALEATHMDPQQRLFLEEAWKALEDAGYAGATIDGKNCGVYVGCTSGDYDRLRPKRSPAHAFWGNAGSVIPARIAYYLNLRGPAIAVDTACSSSLVAIHMACESLRTQETELALAGGVFVQSTVEFYLSASRAGMLSPKGRCHTFDERADGFVPGEGVGAIVLKRLSDAIRDGDHIYGVIRGSGLNQDGKTNGLTAPSANSQQRLERQVYEKFAIDVERIQMVEAHGTGTKLGDPIEFEALTQAFAKDTQKKEFCAVGSIKSNLGHTATAAGVAGVLKILLSLQHKQIPPTLHFDSGNRAIQFIGSPFYVNTKLKEWDVSDGSVRCAAVSSFGFSGTNAHMVIEAPPTVERNHAAKPAYLVVLSARTSEELRQQVRQLVDFCDQHPNADIGNISFTLLAGRRHLNHRLVTIVESGPELLGYLRRWLEARPVPQVQICEISEDRRREDLSLKAFGNECIQICNRTADNHLYLTRLATIATLYAQGYRLEFEELFSHDGYSRLSLPTYPFSRERHWVEADPAVKNESHQAANSSPQLHPLVQHHSTLAGQVYRSEFSGDESFLADHQLGGKRLMPAVAYLEMAIAAGTHALANATSLIHFKLKNVVWASPFAIDGKTKSLIIRLLPKGNTTIDYEITNDANQPEAFPVVYCQGTLETGDFESAPIVDLANLRRVSATARVMNARECYETFQELGIAYGPAHRGLESIAISGDMAVGTLALPPIAISTAGSYFLHPSVMDAALQATVAFFASSKRAKLPYAVDEVTVHYPSESRMWALVRLSNEANFDHRVTKLDIDVCNEKGVICVGLKGLTLRDVGPDRSVFNDIPDTHCLFFKPNLQLKQAVSPAGGPDFSQHWAILCNIPVAEKDILRPDGTRMVVLPPALTDEIAEYFESCVSRIVEVIQEVLHARIPGKKLIQILVAGRGDDREDVFQLLSALAGIVKTIRQEDPSILAQLIEVEPFETESSIADKIRENSRCPQDSVVTYHNKLRHVAGWQEMSLPPVNRERPWKDDGIYLITGGAGGLGQIFAREISRCAKDVTIVIAGRSIPADSRLPEIEKLRANGTTVHCRQVDVSEQAAVDALIRWIHEEIGELNGVFHCAGVLRDSLCLNKTINDIRDVLAPKVSGLVNLDRATEDRKLDFFVCFSSVAGALGNIGQADYAAANAFMDAFASYRDGLVTAGKRHGRTLSINWPLWTNSGLPVSPEAAARLFRRFGMTAMPSATGLQAFYQCWAANDAQLMVLHGDHDRIRKALNSEPESSPVTAGAPALSSPDDSTVISVPSLREKATGYLRQVIAAVLESPVERVKETDSFERYGIDSILALRLTNELEKTFGSLSKILFFEHQNIRSLTDYFIQNHESRLSEVVGSKPAGKVDFSPEGKSEVVLSRPDKLSGKTQPRFQADDSTERVAPSGALDIAIIGLSGRYPGARTINEFWENLKAGKDCISEVPSDRWDYRRYFDADKNKAGTIYNKWGGFIDGVAEFDPLFFNITPREAELMDPQERLFLQCAYETIEDAGYVPLTVGGTNASGMAANVGVFVGVMYEEYQLFGVEETIGGRPIALSGNPAAIANRVSYFCNFSGPCMVVDTMCSSSLTSIHLACQSLRLGECVAAIAGGVNISIHPNKYLLLSQGRFASSVGRCESFGRGGDGYVPGEGVGAVLLKPLSIAIRDGDHIYGVIKGTAVNHGGKTNGFTVPNPNAQATMIGRAIKQAGVRPRAISYIEAHGTGTSLGDPIEIAGLTQIFREDTADRQYCSIGSLKSNIGHCESAAGIGGVTKVLVQLKHRQLVPSLHSRALNPLIDFSETPFRVQQELSNWNQPTITSDGKIRQEPRIAGISSFGAGGSNAHVVIQESPNTAYSPSEQTQADDNEVIIVLSAKTKEQLTRVAANLYAHLKVENQDLAGLAYTLQVGRVAMEERLAFIVKSNRELVERLKGIVDRSMDSPVVFQGNIRHNDETVAMMLEAGDIDQVVAKWVKSGKFDRLAQMWVSGWEIDWNVLYGVRKPRRVSLPTYPFARERYWVPVPAKASINAEVESTPCRETHRPVEKVVLTKEWRPSALHGLEGEPSGVVIVLGTTQTMPLILRLFADRSAIQVVVVLHGNIQTLPAISTDFDSSVAGELLYRELKNRIAGGRLLGVVDCTALDADYGQRPMQELGKIRLIQLLLEHESLHGFKVLQLVFQLYPFQTNTTTLQGARLAGLYRMISAEYRNVQSVVMDVDLGLSNESELATQIQHELLSLTDGAASECCYRQGTRYEPCLVRTKYPEIEGGEVPSLIHVALDHVFVVTGGTRGIGAAVAEHLISRGARRLVLLGREQLPAQSKWKSIVKANAHPELRKKLEFLLSMVDKGVHVRYFNTTLTDLAGLQEMLRQVHSELGPIRGVFHCAGISGENPAFMKKSIGEIEAVCEPKIQGLLALDQALKDEPLNCFVLFSSVSSAIPSLAAGQSDYAMANAFMDFYALHQASRGRKYFKSIQWPAWGETGMAVGKMEIPSYIRTGLTALTTTDGLRFLEFAMSSESTVFLPAVMNPVDFDYSDLLHVTFTGAAARQNVDKENISVKSPEPSRAPTETKRTGIVEWLREIFMSELKLSADQLDETRRFDEYGVDSVMIAQLVRIMQKRVRAKLSPSLLLEYASVAALADYFATMHPDDFADVSVAAKKVSNFENKVSETKTSTNVRVGKNDQETSAADIAIVGISCRFPGAPSKADYWNELTSGDCAIKRNKDLRWQSNDERLLHGGWLEDIDCFDAGYFNLSDQDAAIMDPQARLLLEESLFALCDAGYDPKKIFGEKAGVYIGGRSRISVDMNAVLKAPNPILGAGQNYLATNISRFFNFGGPSVVVDTGCSSAITGMVFASDALRSKRIDMAMVGGVSLLLTSDAHRLFAERKILSENGEFRIFDRQATGEVLGEGAGMVILRRLEDAIADGNPIYGVIKAISMNNDGRTLGPGSPNIHAQKQVMRDALQSAGIGPEDVGYIEVNGGGSPVVDAVEIKALSEVYRLDDRNLQSCFLGSVKPNIGHLLLASGLAGFIRCVLSVHHKRIPPFLSAMEPFEYYDFSSSRIQFNRDAVDWNVAPGKTRIAAQNSYPDGGTNGHILIEEFVPDSSYRQQLFAKPEPLLKRSRFPLAPVASTRTSVPYVTRMAKAEVLRTEMTSFLDTFADTPFDENVEESAPIKTAWGEYVEESI